MRGLSRPADLPGVEGQTQPTHSSPSFHVPCCMVCANVHFLRDAGHHCSTRSCRLQRFARWRGSVLDSLILRLDWHLAGKAIAAAKMCRLRRHLLWAELGCQNSYLWEWRATFEYGRWDALKSLKRRPCCGKLRGWCCEHQQDAAQHEALNYYMPRRLLNSAGTAVEGFAGQGCHS